MDMSFNEMETCGICSLCGEIRGSTLSMLRLRCLSGIYLEAPSGGRCLESREEVQTTEMGLSAIIVT